MDEDGVRGERAGRELAAQMVEHAPAGGAVAPVGHLVPYVLAGAGVDGNPLARRGRCHGAHRLTPTTGSHRPLVRACLDWTERRPHLAGAVGAALCSHALAAGWVARIGTSRALLLTPTGRRAWHDRLGLPPDQL